MDGQDIVTSLLSKLWSRRCSFITVLATTKTLKLHFLATEGQDASLHSCVIDGKRGLPDVYKTCPSRRPQDRKKPTNRIFPKTEKANKPQLANTRKQTAVAKTRTQRPDRQALAKLNIPQPWPPS